MQYILHHLSHNLIYVQNEIHEIILDLLILVQFFLIQIAVYPKNFNIYKPNKY